MADSTEKEAVVPSMEIEPPILAAIKKSLYELDLDPETLYHELKDIKRVMAEFDALMAQIEDGNEEDAAEVADLNDTLTAQEENLNEFEAFVDNVVSRTTPKGVRPPPEGQRPWER